MYKYKACLPSDVDRLTESVDLIISQIAAFIKDDCLLETKLILNELLINAASHGNNFLACKKVEVSVKIENNRIKISVKDEGEGIKREQIKNLYATNGRGLDLVEQLSESLSINRNRVSVIKEIV